MRAETRRLGFTLLEVLAAVAVLGLVYTVLATAAIQGLRAEGDASRRLRASLLADQRITGIEAQVATGQTPEIGETEEQEEEFTVRTVVKPLDLDITETKTAKRARERASRAVGGAPVRTAATPATGGPAGAPGSTPAERRSLLHPTSGSKQPMLRRIDLSVSWEDGENEESVRRTTFGIDAVAAAPLIEELVAAANAEKAQAAEAQGVSPPASDASNGSAAGRPGSGSGSSSTGLRGTGPGSQSQGLRSVPPSGTDMSNSLEGDR